MTEIKVKEYDLHFIIKDLMDEALTIDRPNKTKICNFVVNLVENGGHITNAAMKAGYGPKKTKDGRALTEMERRKLAGNEGSRLLENAGISGLYERLLSHRMIADIFTKSFTREHSIHIFYQMAMMNEDKNPGQALKALKEASTLASHYQIAEVAAAVAEAMNAERTNKDNRDEIIKGTTLLEAILDVVNKNAVSNTKAANSAPKPVNVSETYN